MRARLIQRLGLAAAVFAGAAALRAGDGPDISMQIAGRFAAFAGSAGNAQALVLGLRNGTPITLVSATNSQSVAFSPADGRMGYADAFIAIDLADEALTQAGMNHPTPQEIQEALNGGTVPESGTVAPNSMRGILRLRAAGRDWAAVADDLGVNLSKALSAWAMIQRQFIAAGGKLDLNDQLQTGGPGAAP